MSHGSAYSVVKAALVTQLAARPGLAAVNVSYQAPIKPEDVRSETGAYELIHMGDAEGEMDAIVFGGSANLTWDETYTQEVVIQVLQASSTQQDADDRMEELLYEVVAELANQQAWNFAALDLSQFANLTLVPISARRETGYLEGQNGHGATCVLGVEVQYRRSF